MNETWTNTLTLVLGGTGLCFCWVALELLLCWTFPRGNRRHAEDAEVCKDDSCERVKEMIVHSPSSKPPPDTLCMICLDDSKEPSEEWRSLHCGHHYHLECITNWLQKRLECPLCRESLTGSKSCQKDPFGLHANSAQHEASNLSSGNIERSGSSSSLAAAGVAVLDLELGAHTTEVVDESVAAQVDFLPGAILSSSEWTSVVASSAGSSQGSAMAQQPFCASSSHS